MIDAPTFDELIRRVRTGDQDAATELVRRYEPAVRRAARVRLANGRLRTLLDSMDICQSVMASFFVRAGSGQYELETPDQVLKLLTAMARNKLNSQARRQLTQRRDSRRVVAIDQDEGRFVAAGESPSREVSARDLLQEVYRRLSPDERRLLEMRNQGYDWAAIASEIGGGAEALRRRLSRALDRIGRQLGLDEAP
jgi:RNA polymerase sigma-70 factor (ECF subfamily)